VGAFDVQVTSGLDKVEVDMDAVVGNLLAVDMALLLERRIESDLIFSRIGLQLHRGQSQDCCHPHKWP